MTKINWKKEYEKESDRYQKFRRNSWNRKEIWVYSICWIIFTVFVTFLIILLCGGFDSPVEELGLDKEQLVRGHILDYYPEFENCSIEYMTCVDTFFGSACKKGAKIYCNELDNRDDLKVKRDNIPTEVIYFDDIDLEDILLHKLGRCQ